MIIPCKECISFAICRQRIKEWTNPPDVTTYSKMIDCKRISHYVRDHFINNTEVVKARNLFGLTTKKGWHIKHKDVVRAFKGKR